MFTQGSGVMHTQLSCLWCYRLQHLGGNRAGRWPERRPVSPERAVPGSRQGLPHCHQVCCHPFCTAIARLVKHCLDQHTWEAIEQADGQNGGLSALNAQFQAAAKASLTVIRFVATPRRAAPASSQICSGVHVHDSRRPQQHLAANFAIPCVTQDSPEGLCLTHAALPSTAAECWHPAILKCAGPASASAQHQYLLPCRAFAFAVAPGLSLQTGNGGYDQNLLVALDNVIASAKANNLKLILVRSPAVPQV